MFVVLCLAFLAVAPLALAQTRYNLLAPLPTVSNNPTFAEYMPGLIRFLVLFSVVAAVVMIAIGGLMYALSEAIESQKSARTMISDALFGLAIALLSYLILYTINPDLVNLKLTIPDLPSSGGDTLTSGSAGSPCTSPATCSSGICNSGTCAPVATGRPAGAQCGQNFQCASGSCTFKTPPGTFTCQ